MRFTIGIITAATTLLAAACGSDLTVPTDDTGGSPAETTTGLATLDSTIAAGGTGRVEIKLFPGELVASEFHAERDDNEEKLVSRVTAIDPAQGTITLALGGLIVSYGDGTRFRTDDESHEARATWEAAVQNGLAGGTGPLIEARRNQSGAVQSPDDPSFVANDLRIDDGNDDQKIEIYLDEDNLRSPSGGGLVELRVLGLTIEVSNRTRLFDDHGGNSGGNGDDDSGSDDDDD